MKKIGVAVVVDAYGQGRHFRNIFSEYGLETVHVQGTDEPLTVLKRDNWDNYYAQLRYQGSLEQLAKGLEQYEVRCVVPGNEVGVELADALSEHIGVSSNGSELSAARRNKYLMIERLRECGLRAAKQIKSTDASEIDAWVQQNTAYPVVVKPLNSAGSDGVYICNSKDEVKSAIDENLGQQNIMASNNDEILVQEFLKGEEYVVNTVSCNGHHYVTEMLECEKDFLGSNKCIYNAETLLPSDHQLFSQLQDYTFSVLEALGIRYGACHAELMLTESGPVLIEIGARISGAANPDVMDICVGFNQIRLAVKSYIDEDGFFEIAKTPYKANKYFKYIMFQTPENGSSYKPELVDELSALPFVECFTMKIPPGTTLRKTVDLNSSPGNVHIIDEDRNKLGAYHQTILETFRRNTSLPN